MRAGDRHIRRVGAQVRDRPLGNRGQRPRMRWGGPGRRARRRSEPCRCRARPGDAPSRAWRRPSPRGCLAVRRGERAAGPDRAGRAIRRAPRSPAPGGMAPLSLFVVMAAPPSRSDTRSPGQQSNRRCLSTLARRSERHAGVQRPGTAISGEPRSRVMCCIERACCQDGICSSCIGRCLARLGGRGASSLGSLRRRAPIASWPSGSGCRVPRRRPTSSNTPTISARADPRHGGARVRELCMQVGDAGDAFRPHVPAAAWGWDWR
jgi:hypothetical protein